MHQFEIGELYNRKKDIHAIYGGSQQNGISPSAKSPFIFMFTGVSGEQFGYLEDGWAEDGIFNYTGEGQNGDMTFTRGNRSVRDHVKDGKDILLFQNRGKGRPYRFLGQFVCIGYETKQLPDQSGAIRRGIIFQLKGVDNFIGIDHLAKENESSNPLSFDTLRDRAYSAAGPVRERKASDNKNYYYSRSDTIRRYVLARAKGVCECCGKEAPFIKKDGTPYLEPHHIHKLSDKGLDHPKMMAAITPNCHREIHSGLNGEEIDNRLKKVIAEKENLITANGF